MGSLAVHLHGQRLSICAGRVPIKRVRLLSVAFRGWTKMHRPQGSIRCLRVSWYHHTARNKHSLVSQTRKPCNKKETAAYLVRTGTNGVLCLWSDRACRWDRLLNVVEVVEVVVIVVSLSLVG